MNERKTQKYDRKKHERRENEKTKKNERRMKQRTFFFFKLISKTDFFK